MDARTTRAALIIFVVAALLRLVFLLEFRTSPLFVTPQMDALQHHEWAMSASRGEAFSEGAFYRAPLYPSLLGLVYHVFGSGPWPIRILQLLLGAGTALMTFLIARRLFDARAAWIAGLSVAAYGTLIFYDGQLLVPSLAVFLTTLSLWCLVRAFAQERAPWLAFGGLALGLAATARPTVLLFAALVGLWLLLRRRRFGLLGAVAFAVAVLMPILPVTVQNFRASGEFIPIASSGGLNFYIGNHQGADGFSVRLPGSRSDWRGLMEDSARLAAEHEGRALSAAEQSDSWFRRGLGEIGDDPARALGHAVHKLRLLLSGFEISNNYDLYFFAHRSNLLKVLILKPFPYAPWGLLLPLGVLGAVLGWRRGDAARVPALFLLAMIPAVTLFFVTARFRLPMVPALAIFAGAAVSWLIGEIRSGARSSLLPAALLLLPLLLLGNTDPLKLGDVSDAQGLHTSAGALMEQGKIPEAVDHYRRSLAADSTLSQAANDLAGVLWKLGEREEAALLFRQAVRQAPTDPAPRLNLAKILMSRHRFDEVQPLLDPVVRLQPDNDEALHQLAISNAELGRAAAARHFFGRLRARHPGNPELDFNIAMTHFTQGESDSANLWFRRVLARSPGHAPSAYNLGLHWISEERPDSALHYLESIGDGWGAQKDFADVTAALIDSLRALPR